MQAVLKLMEKNLEMEKAVIATQAKLPQLKISPFNGTVADWVRFENMFVTQADAKPISDEEKFGYLMEMVNKWKGDKKDFETQAKLNCLHNCMGTSQKGIRSNKVGCKCPYW